MMPGRGTALFHTCRLSSQRALGCRPHICQKGHLVQQAPTRQQQACRLNRLRRHNHAFQDCSSLRAATEVGQAAPDAPLTAVECESPLYLTVCSSDWHLFHSIKGEAHNHMGLSLTHVHASSPEWS
jgi:hypothetical protein